MSRNGNSESGGIGFVGLLQVSFIVMKLMGYINWSWLWVLSPMWGGIVLVLILPMLYVIINRWN